MSNSSEDLIGESAAVAADAVVVGGGFAGLAAAAYLAKSGWQVTLLEKADAVGGRGRTFSQFGGLLNLGGHALYRGGAADTVLRELGIPLRGAYPLPAAIAVWNGKVYPFPASLMKLLSTKLLSFGGKMELARLLAKVPKIDPQALNGINLREWAEGTIHDTMVRHLIYSVLRTNTYVPHPEQQQAGPALYQFQRALRGAAYYVDRGWGTLADSLQDTAIRAGVRILTRRSVRRIAFEGSQAAGVVLADGAWLPCRNVIVAAGPDDLYRMTEEIRNPYLIELRASSRPLKAACLDIVLQRLPNAGRENFSAGFWLDQPIFYSNPGTVVNVGDQGATVIHLLKYLGVGPSQPERDVASLEQAMEVVHPGWRSLVLGKRFLPEMTVLHDFYRTDRKSDFAKAAIPGINGLYAAGDWAGDGEMLVDASFASARRAAMAALRANGGGLRRT